VKVVVAVIVKNKRRRIMSLEEKNKAVMRRWYEEMYAVPRFELMPEMAGPEIIRHEPTGTFTATVQEHMERVSKLRQEGYIAPSRTYDLVAEGDKVLVLGTGYDAAGRVQYHFMQLFRLENEKIVEIWFPGYVRGVEW
jgi:predicted SnoaL-like aldol condensation-catalyzing enzyme